MSQFGGLFSAAFVQNLVDQQLRPGAVIYFNCPFTTPEKDKFLVVATCEPDFLVLVINSEINNFISNNPELLACQVDVPQIDHGFLNHDSIVDCVQTHLAFDLTEVKDQIVANYAHHFRGRLQDYCIRNVIEAIENSPTMEPRMIRVIKQALESQLP
ncbi:hypothetical protein [Pantoea sp. ME81]|uniref:hypothetical protein n=1 Tax=Pantoea sp. ME81 TaxID=2743935 RepID=UPI0015F5EA89|nr:hypothetical protein [Pantoea sp. ME81]